MARITKKIFCLSVEKLNHRPGASLQEGWVRTQSGNVTSFTNLLPELSGDNMVLGFRNFNRGVEVEIDGRKTYSYGVEEKPPFGSVYGSSFCLVHLDDSDSGKKIKISFDNRNLAVGIRSMGKVYLGQSDSAAIYIIWNSMDVILCMLVMGCMSAAALIIFLLQILRRKNRIDSFYFHMSMFMLLSALWIFSDSLLVQLVTSRTLLYGCILSFLSLMLIPQPLLSIAKRFCPCATQHFQRLKIILWGYIAAALFLYIMDSADLITTLPILHLIFLLTALEIVYFSMKEFRVTKSIYAKYCFYSVGFLFLVVVVNLALFYLGYQNDISKVFRYGLGILTVCILALCFKTAKNSIEYNSRYELYKKMAFLDDLTKMKNRNAYIRQMEYLEEPEREYRYLEVIMFDINNLKYVNDTYGHESGDQLITHTAQMIRDLFPQDDMCYRIGGDEFIVFLCDKEIKESVLCTQISVRCAELLKTKRIDLSISVGCACAERKNGRMDVAALVKEADEKMYKNKNSCKSEEKR